MRLAACSSLAVLSLWLVACGEGESNRGEIEYEQYPVPPSCASSTQGVVSTGVPVTPGVTSTSGVTPTSGGCAEPPPARQPFEAVDVDVERFAGAPTADLDDGELGELCEALAPAFEADCELFAVGSAIEHDALAQAEFETECAGVRSECIEDAQRRCLDGLGATACEATAADAKLCLEGRANAKGAAVAEIDGLAITCDNSIFDLLQASFRAGELRPAKLSEEVTDACELVDACLKLDVEVAPPAASDTDAGAEQTDGGTPSGIAGDAGEPDSGAPSPDAGDGVSAPDAAPLAAADGGGSGDASDAGF